MSGRCVYGGGWNLYQMMIKKREVTPSFSILSICAGLPDFVFQDVFRRDTVLLQSGGNIREAFCHEGMWDFLAKYQEIRYTVMYLQIERRG